MTQSSESVDTVMKATYPLQIASRCSSEVEQICQKNSLSFVELMRPFTTLNGPCMLRDCDCTICLVPSLLSMTVTVARLVCF